MAVNDNKNSILRASIESMTCNHVGKHQTARHLIPANLMVQQSEGGKNLTALQQVNQVLMPYAPESAVSHSGRAVSKRAIRKVYN